PDAHCVQGRARLDTLVALDRPILLRLRDGGADAWAVLLGADARSVRLRIGGRSVDIDRALLQAHWNGDYAGLWRGPAILDTPPVPGASGTAVDWLWLRVLPDAARPGAPYDATLRQAVRELQSARGLPADGVAGAL